MSKRYAFLFLALVLAFSSESAAQIEVTQGTLVKGQAGDLCRPGGDPLHLRAEDGVVEIVFEQVCNEAGEYVSPGGLASVVYNEGVAAYMLGLSLKISAELGAGGKTLAAVVEGQESGTSDWEQLGAYDLNPNDLGAQFIVLGESDMRVLRALRLRVSGTPGFSGLALHGMKFIVHPLGLVSARPVGPAIISPDSTGPYVRYRVRNTGTSGEAAGLTFHTNRAAGLPIDLKGVRLDERGSEATLEMGYYMGQHTSNKVTLKQEANGLTLCASGAAFGQKKDATYLVEIILAGKPPLTKNVAVGTCALVGFMIFSDFFQGEDGNPKKSASMATFTVDQIFHEHQNPLKIRGRMNGSGLEDSVIDIYLRSTIADGPPVQQGWEEGVAAIWEFTFTTSARAWGIAINP